MQQSALNPNSQDEDLSLPELSSFIQQNEF
jgi:hypothetical protein